MKITLIQGNTLDALPKLPLESVDLCITSPPYWGLRDYGSEYQLGLEPTMEEYLDHTLLWVKEVWRVLKSSGSFVLNLGDCFLGGGTAGTTGRAQGVPTTPICGKNLLKTNRRYAKAKQLLSISSFAYCKIVSETDFVCRGEHIWAKPNVPSPIRSRLKHSHEKLFWFVKDADEYYFDERPWLKKVLNQTLKRNEYGRIGKSPQLSCGRMFEKGDFVKEDNKTIEHSWRIVSCGEKQKGFELNGKQTQEHIAPFPEALIKPYVESLCPREGVVLDPFVGSGTVLKIARDLKLNGIGIDLNARYISYAKNRLNWGEQVSGYAYEVLT